MTIKARHFLAEKGYKYIELNLSTIGNYSSLDSEWNYSDVQHFKHVHHVFNQVILGLTNTSNSSFFLQKNFFITIANIIYQIHENPGVHEYLAVALNIPISIITYHDNNEKLGKLKTETKTNYHFYYRSFFGFILAKIAVLATKRNYKKVISEDMPMRTQRGILRKNNNISFKQDQKNIIGFLDTTNISESNIFFSKGYKFNGSYILNFKDCFINIEEIYLKLEVKNEEILALPLICSHEGASLKKTCGEEVFDNCPWHGKKVAKIFSTKLPVKNEKIIKQYLGANLEVNLIKLEQTSDKNYSIKINLEA